MTVDARTDFLSPARQSERLEPDDGRVDDPLRWDSLCAGGDTADEHHGRREVAGLRIVECISAPNREDVVQGIARDEGLSCVGMQITRSGSEWLRSGDTPRVIGPGAMVIWTSDEPVELISMDRLHKFCILVPWEELRDRLPRTAHFRGAVLERTSGLGAVLHSHVDALVSQVDPLVDEDGCAIRRATTELLAAAMLHSLGPRSPVGLSHQYLLRIQNYILDHLQDESLGPAHLAKTHNISERYLHLLFARTGHSVSSFIRQHRLDRCREALANPACGALCVAEIAHRWGFPSPAHFSRVFKQRFGMSPTEARIE